MAYKSEEELGIETMIRQRNCSDAKLPTFTLPTTILKSILFVSLNSLTMLVFLAGSGAILLHGLPSSAIDAFVISISFAFSGALSALLVPQRHNLAAFCALCSLASVASALLLLIWGLYYAIVLAKAQPTTALSD